MNESKQNTEVSTLISNLYTDSHLYNAMVSTNCVTGQYMRHHNDGIKCRNAYLMQNRNLLYRCNKRPLVIEACYKNRNIFLIAEFILSIIC